MTGGLSGLFSFCFLPADRLYRKSHSLSRMLYVSPFFSFYLLTVLSLSLSFYLSPPFCYSLLLKLPFCKASLPLSTSTAKQEGRNLSQIWQKLRMNTLNFPCLFPLYCHKAMFQIFNMHILLTDSPMLWWFYLRQYRKEISSARVRNQTKSLAVCKGSAVNRERQRQATHSIKSGNWRLSIFM